MDEPLLLFTCSHCGGGDRYSMQDLIQTQKKRQTKGVKLSRCSYGCGDDADLILREVQTF